LYSVHIFASLTAVPMCSVGESTVAVNEDFTDEHVSSAYELGKLNRLSGC